MGKNKSSTVEEPEHNLPDSLLVKLFDRTGNERGGNRGFFLFFVNSRGEPSCISNFADMATRCALEKVILDLQISLDHDKEF